MVGGGGVRVMVATKPVDFRKGAEGLAALVRDDGVGSVRGRSMFGVMRLSAAQLSALLEGLAARP